MFWIGLISLILLICGVVIKFTGREMFEDADHKKINVGLITLGIIFIVSIFAPFTIISAGFKGVVIQLGAVKPIVLNEGIHFRIPIIQSIEQVDCRI